MKKPLIASSVLLANILTSGYASAQADQAVGTDFAVTKENVPQKEPVYSPYVGLSLLKTRSGPIDDVAGRIGGR